MKIRVKNKESSFDKSKQIYGEKQIVLDMWDSQCPLWFQLCNK